MGPILPISSLASAQICFWHLSRLSSCICLLRALPIGLSGLFINRLWARVSPDDFPIAAGCGSIRAWLTRRHSTSYQVHLWWPIWEWNPCLSQKKLVNPPLRRSLRNTVVACEEWDSGLWEEKSREQTLINFLICGKSLHVVVASWEKTFDTSSLTMEARRVSSTNYSSTSIRIRRYEAISNPLQTVRLLQR